LTSHLRHQTKSFALNQSESDTIVSFDVDQVSRALAANGQVIKTGSPVCMIFKTS
jgi:6-phosphogluconolactonase (cycloisomerase 2 family)